MTDLSNSELYWSAHKLTHSFQAFIEIFLKFVMSKNVESGNDSNQKHVSWLKLSSRAWPPSLEDSRRCGQEYKSALTPGGGSGRSSRDSDSSALQ